MPRTVSIRDAPSGPSLRRRNVMKATTVFCVTATPNGQAAFLFLLTSALAPLIRLSYGRMLWMALPSTVTMTLTGLWALIYLL
jgi:NhaB family Na+:H+ antiporter